MTAISFFTGRWRGSRLAPLLIALSLEGGCHKGINTPGAAAGAGLEVGSVTVMVADHPREEIEHLFIDVSRVSLLSTRDGSPVAIFEGKERIDLLRFRDLDFLLAVYTRVPAGDYRRIRLEFSGIAVEPSERCSQLEAASGKIDLVSRDPIRVRKDTPLFLRLDLDARKSLSIHGTAGDERCGFRPVVSARVHHAGEEREPCSQEVSGKIVEIRGGGAAGREDPRSRSGDRPLEAVLALELGQERGTVRVELVRETALFGADALRSGLSGFKVGDTVVAPGKIEDHSRIEADWVIQGTPLSLQGSFRSAISGGQFTFAADGAAQTREARATTDTLTFPRCGDAPLLLAGIGPGQPARILGVEIAQDGGSFVQVAVIELSSRQVRGKITSLDRLAGEIVLDVAGSEAAPVDFTFLFDARTMIVLSGGGALGTEELKEGETVTADLDETVNRASRISVEPEDLEGGASQIDAGNRSFLLTESAAQPESPRLEVLVKVALDARVLLAEGETLSEADLGGLKDDDRVVLFGLAPDPGTFDAHTVVIHR
jgi:hypothetical protein